MNALAVLQGLTEYRAAGVTALFEQEFDPMGKAAQEIAPLHVLDPRHNAEVVADINESHRARLRNLELSPLVG